MNLFTGVFQGFWQKLRIAIFSTPLGDGSYKFYESQLPAFKEKGNRCRQFDVWFIPVTREIHSLWIHPNTRFFLQATPGWNWLKNQANAKQDPKTELLLFENYSHSSSTLSSKNNRAYSKKQANEQVSLYSWDYPINHNENEDENDKKIT